MKTEPSSSPHATSDALSVDRPTASPSSPISFADVLGSKSVPAPSRAREIRRGVPGPRNEPQSPARKPPWIVRTSLDPKLHASDTTEAGAAPDSEVENAAPDQKRFKETHDPIPIAIPLLNPIPLDPETPLPQQGSSAAAGPIEGLSWEQDQNDPGSALDAPVSTAEDTSPPRAPSKPPVSPVAPPVPPTPESAISPISPVGPISPISPIAEAALEAPAEPPPESHGIPAAKLSPDMKTAPNLNTFAGSSEQNLPHEFSGGQSDPGSKESHPAFLETAGAVAWLSRVAQDSGPLTFESASIGPNHGGPSQEVLLQISKHAVELKQFKANSMSVVLKPDAQTEIFLRLSVQDGMVDVYARFERGDSNLLKNHWAEMQQSLQNQGIRLGPLQDSLFQDSSTAFDTSHFDKSKGEAQNGHGHNQNHDHDHDHDRSAAIPVRTTLVRPQPARIRTSAWESWA